MSLTPMKTFTNSKGELCVWYDTKDRVYDVENLIIQSDVYDFIDELYLGTNIRERLGVHKKLGVFDTTNKLVNTFDSLEKQNQQLKEQVEVLREAHKEIIDLLENGSDIFELFHGATEQSKQALAQCDEIGGDE